MDKTVLLELYPIAVVLISSNSESLSSESKSYHIMWTKITEQLKYQKHILINLFK